MYHLCIRAERDGGQEEGEFFLKFWLNTSPYLFTLAIFKKKKKKRERENERKP